jgi:hypothetical protein
LKTVGWAVDDTRAVRVGIDIKECLPVYNPYVIIILFLIPRGEVMPI